MPFDLSINKDQFYQNTHPKNALSADEVYVDDIFGCCAGAEWNMGDLKR